MTRLLSHDPARAWVLIPATALALLATPARPADPADPNWPCQQRKTPTISAAQVWTGPPVDAIGDSWRDDGQVAELARTLAQRRTTLDEAKPLIAEFAESAGAEREQKVTALAAGVLALLNADRASIIAGIERYAARQKQLAAKIERQTAELAALPEDGSEAEQSQRADLVEIQAWDTRIFQERERSLVYVCELPVEIERRAFALGRELATHLEP